MSAKGLFIFEVSVTLLIIGGVGFIAWQTQNIMRSLDRMATAQEDTLKGVEAALVRTEQEVRKVGGKVRPNVEQWIKALEKPLVAKTNSMVRKAQRSELDRALKKWSHGNKQQNEKQWQKLFVTLRREGKEAQKEHRQAENKWQELAKALREEQETLRKKYQKDETRWLNLMETLRKQGERSDKQFREVVQQLTKEKEEAQARARQLEEERKREINKLLEQAKQIELQRNRELSEFCSKRPESVICRDL